MLKSPWGIAVTNEHVYITEEGLHALFQLDKNTYQLVPKDQMTDSLTTF